MEMCDLENVIYCGPVPDISRIGVVRNSLLENVSF
jgi:hypothetical protein